MNLIILMTSPNMDGLTAACADAARQGVLEAGGTADVVHVNDLNIQQCRACNNGWGSCLDEHRCQVRDDFQPLHQKIQEAEGLVIVTPVYWGEMSESAKALTDRVRRSEATRREGSYLAGKPFLGVAAAGGSGGGMITCLASMERWQQHVRMRLFDLIPVNRWSRVYKLQAIRAAACAMASNEESG